MRRVFFSFALAVALTTSSMWAQSVISAHSGVIHLTEGTVELDGQAVQSPAKLGEFVDVKTGQTLATKDGDAEVLLTPGVFLRLAENSSFKMVSNKLDDTRIEVLGGSAMVQVGELLGGQRDHGCVPQRRHLPGKDAACTGSTQIRRACACTTAKRRSVPAR